MRLPPRLAELARKTPFFVWVSAALALATLVAYWPTFFNDFVRYDDHKYIMENEVVMKGISWEGFVWAFEASELANWFPLTWLSHEVDAQLFGLWAGGHHATSLAMHILNAVLLFLVLLAATGARWRSALVAALFALHPIHVESVAWVAERKDVLSTLFWMLAMLAWIRYARRPGTGRYALVAGLFAMGIMSKPVVITFPLVLILMDWWPLGRWSPWPPPGEPAPGGLAAWYARREFYRPLVEKLPLLMLSGVSSVITFFVQRKGGAMGDAPVNRFAVHLGNAMWAYFKYVWNMLWPAGLSPIYPHTMSREPWLMAARWGIPLVLLTAGLIWVGRRKPYLAFGWLWYIGTLVPMIGIVQVGIQGMADRYTYIPLTGVFIFGVWGLAEVLARRPGWRRAAAVAAGVVLAVLMVLTNLQLAHWKDTVALFTRAVEVDPRNAIARLNLGYTLQQMGRLEESNNQLRTALEIFPTLNGIHEMIGDNLLSLKRYGEAAFAFGNELARQPRNAEIHFKLGYSYEQVGRAGEAMNEYQEAVRLDPRHVRARYNLGLLLAANGRNAEALQHFMEVYRLDPKLKVALEAAEKVRAAIRAGEAKP